MRALCIREAGPQGRIELAEVPDPVPGPGEVLISVKAAALNRADLLQRRGLYPAPPDSPADIPGLEYAGVVEARGPQVQGLAPGDRVMGIVGGGAFAEKLVVHERAAIRAPARLDWPALACVPEAFLTAFDALLLQARLMPGERVLIHAVGSGVGTAAVQLASLVGAQILGTARSADKLERAKPLGLSLGIHTAEPRFADEVLRATGGQGADVVLDLVGGAYLEENVRALAPRGRLIAVGLVAGASGKLSLGTLLSKRLTLVGTVLRSRPIEEKIALARAFERQVLPHLESGRLVPVLERALPFTEIDGAMKLLESNATFGKVALVW